MGATILPPDINLSQTDFTVVYAAPEGDFKPPRGSKEKDRFRPQIRFGLGAVRGIGDSALLAVFEARAAGGPFHDLFDFSSRVDARRVNKATLESLIQCGAFDSTLAPRGISRARAFAAVDLALERSRSASRDRERGQTTLFSLLENRAGEGDAPQKLDEYPPSDPWDLRDTLKREKQALGFYVSGHPLGRYGKELRRFDVTPLGDLAGLAQWTKVRVAGVVENYRDRMFKNGGGRVAFFELEDEIGRVDVKVAEKRIETCAPLLNAGEPVLIEGKVTFPMGADDEPDDETAKKPTILLETVQPLADAIQAETRGISIRLAAERTKPDHLKGLRDVLVKSPGNCPVSVVIDLGDGAQAILALSAAIKVAPSDAMLAGLERLFGENVAELR